MPAIKPVSTRLSRGTYRVEWLAVTESDTFDAAGPALGIPMFSDKSVQFDGTFGGGTFTLEGSNDGTSFFGLNDPSSTAISHTAAGLDQVLENPSHIRPARTGGTGVSINVRLVIHGKLEVF